MNEPNLKVAGFVTLKIKHFDGTEEIREGKNLVVSGGQNLFCSLMGGLPVDPPSHLAVGDSNIAPSKSQTALQGTEHERISATVNVTDNTITCLGTFGTGIGSEVTCNEFGLFNGTSPAGIMIARWTTPEFTLPSTSTIEVTWRLTIGA